MLPTFYYHRYQIYHTSILPFRCCKTLSCCSALTLLEEWGAIFKTKVTQQAKSLSKTPMLDYLIKSAEENPDEDEEVPGK